jgi:hypothetical protein
MLIGGFLSNSGWYVGIPYHYRGSNFFQLGFHPFVRRQKYAGFRICG